MYIASDLTQGSSPRARIMTRGILSCKLSCTIGDLRSVIGVCACIRTPRVHSQFDLYPRTGARDPCDFRHLGLGWWFPDTRGLHGSFAFRSPFVATSPLNHRALPLAGLAGTQHRSPAHFRLPSSVQWLSFAPNPQRKPSRRAHLNFSILKISIVTIPVKIPVSWYRVMTLSGYRNVK